MVYRCHQVLSALVSANERKDFAYKLPPAIFQKVGGNAKWNNLVIEGAFAMWVDDVLDMVIISASVKCRSVMAHMTYLPCFVFDNSSSISIATNSKGPDAGKSCNGCLWR